MLGILAYSLRVPEVQCFSYEHGTPSPGSDAAVSKRMAECAGYSHETVETYGGDFVRHLRDNAAIGLRNSLSWYCAELGAWQRMAPRLAAVERPVVFVGDECLGWRNYGLADYGDVLASLQIHHMRILSWLIPLLPNESRIKLNDGLEQDLERLRVVASNEAHGNWHNAKDYLYLDQRLGHLILPWREACVPEGVAVRSPLLDNDILELIARTPIAGRLNKRLYRKTITAMYPQLFRIPRSSVDVNFYLDLAREFTANADEVRRMIRTQSSRLDELIPPDVLERLLGDVLNGRGPSGSGIHQEGAFTGAIGRVVNRTVRNFVPLRPPVRPIEPPNILLRLIILRMALAPD